MSNFYYTRQALQYILDHEREDFEQQCEEHGLTLEQGLSELDTHVYYAASRALLELEQCEEKEAATAGTFGDSGHA